MDLIHKLTNELAAEMNCAWNEYVGLHNELDKYRGKSMENDLEEINKLIDKIQNKFASLYPVYHFIAVHHQHANNAVNSYNEFIEVLKKAGARQDEPIKAGQNVTD